MGAGLSPLSNLIVGIWVASEIVLSFLRRSKTSSAESLDRSSLRLLWTTIIASVTATIMISGSRYGAIAGLETIGEPLGIALVVVGMIIRWVAILSLKRSFTVDVAVASGQQVVADGIYRWIRHPSYLGSILSFVGFGIALRHWAGLILLVVPITLAFLYRIRVEERALNEGLGEAYASYARRTKRLVPFVY
jgi:protein-S-isoprenylcysteine O-methyltransferase Ste14